MLGKHTAKTKNSIERSIVAKFDSHLIEWMYINDYFLDPWSYSSNTLIQIFLVQLKHSF